MRMCVDFTDLNKACPKDSYPLPSIDALVDSAAGCKLLSFLDAFSGYNQIKMHPMDEEKTAFMTERSCYCYKVMPFGLKNAGATYQRLMDRVLAPMLGRNVQAYVDVGGGGGADGEEGATLFLLVMRPSSVASSSSSSSSWTT